MIKETIIAIVFLIVFALTDSRVSAEVITIEITAEIGGMDDRDGLLEGRISVGDIITGSYTYDSDTPDTNPSHTVGEYWHYSSPYGISLSARGFVFQTDPDNVDFLVSTLDDHTGQDGYLLRSYNNLPLSNGVNIEHISWQLDDYSCTALFTDTLPTTPPVLEDWENNYLRIRFGYGGDSGIGARVTSAIPEPATFLLFGLGALALLKNRRSA
jgi:hypothetical protein